MSESKDTNPKDAIGVRKVALSALPIRVLWRVGLAMMEGALKYGRHNYRAAGVRASVYFDASLRHKFSWWEGEDIDAESMIHHIDKEIACMMVLRDSILQGNWVDDRPPRAVTDLAELNTAAAKLMDLHASKSPYHYTIKDPQVAAPKVNEPSPVGGLLSTWAGPIPSPIPKGSGK